MRKFTLIAALAFFVMGVNAQDLNFVRGGEVVKDGTTLEVKDLIVDKWGFGKLDAELFVQNAGSAKQEATLTISVLEGEPIGFCSFLDNPMEGKCLTVSKGNPQSRTKNMNAGETCDPQVHPMAIVDTNGPEFKDFKYNTKVEYKLTYGSTTKTVIVNINYDAATSITAVYGENSVYVADNALQYSFGKAASRSLNIYNITGALVKSEVLENAGAVAFDNLNKGIYLYEIIENGKRIAAHKCVIR